MEAPLIELPPALAACGITLRDERDDDLAFLIDLYGSTRQDELALLPDWSDADKAAFVTQQFGAQRHHYRTMLSDLYWAIIERDGQPIGRLYLEPRRTQVQLVDITLHPDHRGAGLGTALIDAVIASAGRRRMGVGLFVERYNPALGLYRRLGFETVVEHDIYVELARAPADQLKTAS